MESSPNQTPDIPLGITFPKELETPSEDKEEEEDHPDMLLAEALCMLQESEWEGKRVKANLLLAALDRPIPESFVAGQTFPHPFFTQAQEEDLIEHYYTFLKTL